MRKNFSNLASLVAAVVFICGGFVCTSCSEQQAIAPEPEKVYTPGPTQYIDRTIKQIIDNILIGRTNKTNVELLYNGKLVRRASVSPDSRILYLPADQQVEPTLEYKGDGRWIDSNGMGFTATEENFPEDSLTLTSAVTAEKKMDLFRIHEKVAQISANFVDEGMATDLQSGKPGTYSLPMPNADYFVSDSSVTVRIEKETEIQIEWRDSIVVKDSIVYVDRTEYVTVNREKNLAIVHGFGYGELRFFRDGKTFVYRVDLLKTNILREENAWGVATKVSESMEGFNLSDGQVGTYTVETNGVSLESILFVGAGASFTKLNDTFKYGTVTTKVAFSYDEDGENVREEYEVRASYFHELAVKAEPSVVTPEITTEHVYEVDTVPSVVKDAEGHITGEKVRVTVKKDGEVWFKAQYMRWETGLLNPTITGTQVGGNNQLRATEHNWDEYQVEGWWGTEDLKGATLTAYAKEFHFNTPFPKVPGFGGAEEAVAKSNIVFGTRDFYLKDSETGWELSIPAGKMDVKIIQDEVGTDEAAKAEINARGLQYEYCGTHFLSVEQYVNGKLVNTQSRSEQLLSPKN